MNGLIECESCRKVFKNQYSLQRHINVVHNGCRPYECECGKLFATNEQLTRHRNSKHTFEKPYICQKGCDKAFASYTARDYHHKTKHDQIKYVCFCGKVYSSKINLRNHCSKPHIPFLSYWMYLYYLVYQFFLQSRN